MVWWCWVLVFAADMKTCWSLWKSKSKMLSSCRHAAITHAHTHMAPSLPRPPLCPPTRAPPKKSSTVFVIRNKILSKPGPVRMKSVPPRGRNNSLLHTHRHTHNTPRERRDKSAELWWVQGAGALVAADLDVRDKGAQRKTVKGEARTAYTGRREGGKDAWMNQPAVHCIACAHTEHEIVFHVFLGVSNGIVDVFSTLDAPTRRNRRSSALRARGYISAYTPKQSSVIERW